MITSRENSRMKNLALLMKKAKERKARKLFIAEGIRMVGEAPADWIRGVYAAESFGERRQEQELLARLREGADKGGYLVETVSDAVFAAVSDTKTPQGILAVLKIPEYCLSDLLSKENPLLLLLEGIQDPGNLGTMFRSGEGAGVSGVIFDRETADLFNPKTVRSTMGSIFRVPFLETEDLMQTIHELKRAGVALYAAHLDGSVDYDEPDYTKASGFLIGNEGGGLSREPAEAADARVRIPMEGRVESLNAAVSASLLLYEACRQRRRQK